MKNKHNHVFFVIYRISYNNSGYVKDMPILGHVDIYHQCIYIDVHHNCEIYRIIFGVYKSYQNKYCNSHFWLSSTCVSTKLNIHKTIWVIYFNAYLITQTSICWKYSRGSNGQYSRMLYIFSHFEEWRSCGESESYQRVHPQKYASRLLYVLFCCYQFLANVTYILQDYFTCDCWFQ